ncbi:hypothetical protein Hanom_Chr00s072505g01789411 [Helianthus anomalus]
MEAELSPDKGNLGALGDPDATGVPKKHVEKVVAGGGAVGEKKRKVDVAGAGERKRPKLRTTRIDAILQPKPAIVTGRLTKCVQARSSPPRGAAADLGANKEFKRSPSINVVTLPSSQAEDTGKKAVGQTIFDTVDSSDKLIEPRDLDVEGGGENEVS